MTESRDAQIVGIGRGVDYLHSRSPHILHGDIHPVGVLATRSFVV